MIKTYNVDYFYPQDLIYQLSLLSQKAVMYIRADGPNSCEDDTKKEEIWQFYYDKCDNVVVDGLRDDGEMYCYFTTVNQAFDCFNEWFPQKSDLQDDEMEFYIYARIVSVPDSVDVVNGV
jgi:hypothetical protein